MALGALQKSPHGAIVERAAVTLTCLRMDRWDAPTREVMESFASFHRLAARIWLL